MAERKYDLALISTVTDKKVRPQTWYRERLKTKQIKSLKPTDCAKSLVGKNWTFLKDGLDDFRDGLPPENVRDVFLKNPKGPGPIIVGSSEDIGAVKRPAVRRRFDKYQICFSRVTPLQQQRREHIEEIEFGLLQHPLALYPHLEESVPPELFEDIVDILDPEMNMASDDESSEADLDDAALPGSDEHQGEKESADTRRDDGENLVRNPYRWLPRKDERDKKDKKKASERRTSSPSQEEHIKNVTKEFCDWVASLGGESNNIEESTITSLFASGYETKPALSVPIHVVELTNVPPELRMSATVPSQQQAATKTIPDTKETPKRWLASGTYEPSWVKFNYGAWYLNPKTWKKRDHDVPLKDPKELKDQEMSEAKKKSHSLNQDLSTMHGSKAFMDFIDKKGTRKPEFLVEVAEIQRLAAEEEQRRILAEQAAKHKRALTVRTGEDAERNK